MIQHFRIKEIWIRLIFAAIAALFLANGTGLGHSQTAAPGASPAQPSFDATRLWEPVDVGGTWLIHAGDDPAYAAPQFDDSHWTRWDIGKSLHLLFPAGNPGVIWYRMRVKVAPDQIGLAVRERNVSNAFVVYSNVVELLKAGRFAPYVPYRTYAPLIARIPDAQIATGSIVLALRVHIDDEEWKHPNPGLYPDNIRLGRQQEFFRERWFDVMQVNGVGCVQLLITAILSAAGLILFSADRVRKEYLWLSLFGLSLLLSNSFYLYTVFHVYPAWWAWLRVIPQLGFFWFIFPMYFAFVRQRIRPLLAGLIFICCLGGPALSFPGLSRVVAFSLGAPINVLVITVIPALLIVHWRRGNREAGLLLLPVLLYSAEFFSLLTTSFMFAIGHPYTGSWTLRPIAHLGSFVITLIDVTEILLPSSLGLIILFRSNRMSREASVHEGQIAAAREVQQILVPEEIEVTPGFCVDTCYLPAQQVGGDFFQVVPIEDNGMLVVVGDVAGKGLPAAMMVSVLVGAIRTLATFTQKPAEVLAQLNERLVGRSGGGFSTAIAAHIASDGLVNIASAGHLSPYLDGEELALPGALPLGIISGTTYDTLNFKLNRGSRLTFYSDGVVEAQNASGDLMGFERGRELSTQSADTIVAAAQKFGQSDDITVVGIVRE